MAELVDFLGNLGSFRITLGLLFSMEEWRGGWRGGNVVRIFSVGSDGGRHACV